MKTTTFFKPLGTVAFVALCLAAPVAKAIPLSFSTSGVGFWAPGSAANNPADATVAANGLVNWYNGGANPSAVGITFTLQPGSGLPPPALPTPLAFGFEDETNPFDGIDSTLYSYVLAKYGNVTYIFYLGNLAPGIYTLPASGPNDLGLSHEIGFSATVNRVPDGGTTAALLGISLLGLAALQRKLKRA